MELPKNDLDLKDVDGETIYYPHVGVMSMAGTF
jgi:hypothetical protein